MRFIAIIIMKTFCMSSNGNAKNQPGNNSTFAGKQFIVQQNDDAGYGVMCRVVSSPQTITPLMCVIAASKSEIQNNIAYICPRCPHHVPQSVSKMHIIRRVTVYRLYTPLGATGYNGWRGTGTKSESNIRLLRYGRFFFSLFTPIART